VAQPEDAEEEDEMVKKSRRPWDSAEVRELRAMARRRIAVRKMAERFGRTEGALRQKLWQLDIRLRRA
jgi:hypothetical protein